jgi:hypothetical protein
MKRIIAAMLIVCFCVLCGCASSTVVAADNGPMFVTVEEGYCWYVVYHKETKVMYVVSDGGYNRGNFSLLVNPDGTPMLWED